jgi:hypothetical protein
MGLHGWISGTDIAYSCNDESCICIAWGIELCSSPATMLILPRTPCSQDTRPGTDHSMAPALTSANPPLAPALGYPIPVGFAPAADRHRSRCAVGGLRTLEKAQRRPVRTMWGILLDRGRGNCG